MAVVEEAGRRLKKHPDPRVIKKRLVVLDADRIETDRAGGLTRAARHDPQLRKLLDALGL